MGFVGTALQGVATEAKMNAVNGYNDAKNNVFNTYDRFKGLVGLSDQTAPVDNSQPSVGGEAAATTSGPGGIPGTDSAASDNVDTNTGQVKKRKRLSNFHPVSVQSPPLASFDTSSQAISRNRRAPVPLVGRQQQQQQPLMTFDAALQEILNNG